MKRVLTALLCAGPAPVSCAGGPDWVPVPAAQGVVAASVPGFPDPGEFEVIRLVGVHGSRGDAAGPPARVFTVEIGAAEGGAAGIPPGQAIPADARWPDANDRIDAGPAGDPSRAGPAGTRNPWEVRLPRMGVETVFACGGVIDAGMGGAVAILNGRVARRGDSFGGFGVAVVVAAGVVLERNGVFFVIPRGRRATLSEEGR